MIIKEGLKKQGKSLQGLNVITKKSDGDQDEEEGSNHFPLESSLHLLFFDVSSILEIHFSPSIFEYALDA
jgi:hypothetical protein